MDKTLKIVLVEDVLADAELALHELQAARIDYTSHIVDNEQDLREILTQDTPDIVLSDLALSRGFDGYRALEICRELAAGIPFIFVSGTMGEDEAVESLKYGAADYILKNNLKRLPTAVQRALEEARQQAEQRKAEQELAEQWAFFRKILDIDRNMIFVKDAEGRFVLVNEAVASVFGTTVENMIGKTNSDFISDKGLVDKFYQDEQEVIETQKEKFIPEVNVRYASGKDRWLQVVMRPISSTDGNEWMVLGVSSDITNRIELETELRRNVERFEIIARATNDAIWDWDMVSNSLWWNESFKILFGYSDDDIGWNVDFWKENIHPNDKDRIVEDIDSAVNRGEKYWEGEYRFCRCNGSYAHVHDHGYIIYDSQGQAARMLGSMLDITEQYEQGRKIKRLNRIRDIMREINSAIVRMRDRKLLLEEVCRICVEHGGFTLAWVSLMDEVTQDIKPVASYGDSRGYLQRVGFSAHGDKREGQTLTGRALREQRPIVSNDITADDNVIYNNELLEVGFRAMAAFPVFVDDNAIGTLSLYVDETNIFDKEEIELISELVSDVSFALEYIEKEEKVTFLAYYDNLTGLSNRDLFVDRLNQFLHSSNNDRIYGIILIDIERFSYVNEVYGRQVGDKLLKSFSDNLKKLIPESGHVARLASNTFSILLSDISGGTELANFIEQKLLPQADHPLVIDGNELKMSIRVGVALTPMDGSDTETLIKNAEAALKSAKQSGDRYLFYTRDMNAQVAEKLILENKLKRALDENEFVLFYQPKIDLFNKKLCGLEALIRWRTDEGLVPPDKFIPILEETGLILDVGKWVLRQACHDYQDWKQKGLQPPPIAVNISPIQLKQTNFLEQIDEITGSSAENYEGLELEITETVIMENLEQNIIILEAIRGRTIGISIDDFGTGYSSLRYMSQLPVTSLKIDRTFISNILNNDYDTAIVSAVIPLAHSLNLKVIAEGVENEEQSEVLRRMGCNQYQGYLFSPAVPADEIEILLQTYRPDN